MAILGKVMDARERIRIAGADEAGPVDHGRLDRAEPLANLARGMGVTMRVLRLSLLLIVTLALPCGPTSATTAQDKDLKSGDWLAPTEGVFFAGGDCSMDVAAAERTALPSGGGFETRGLPITCEVEFGEPRLSGTQTIVDNTDCFQQGGCIHWGTVDIAGVDGSWSGWFTGTEYPDTSTDLYIVLSGAGTYEGLTSIRHAHGSFWEALQQVGLIYEGPPPPIAPND